MAYPENGGRRSWCPANLLHRKELAAYRVHDAIPTLFESFLRERLSKWLRPVLRELQAGNVLLYAVCAGYSDE